MIRPMVDHGYVEFVYDWGKDRPALRITALGRSHLLSIESRDITVCRTA